MNRISVVFYSFTGNTMRMVNALEKGLEEAGVDYRIYRIAEIDIEAVFSSDIIAMASPANGAEEINKDYFQPFMIEHGEKFKGKKVYLFGSYGWGGGKYLLNWKENLEKLGATIVAEPILSNGSPNAEIKEKLKEMAKKLANI